MVLAQLSKRPWSMVDEQEDDWAPLSEDQLAMRPGEVEDAKFVGEFSCKQAAPESAAPEQPVAPPAEKPVDPRAEQMMRDLQERVAKAGQGDSLIAQVQRRAQRVARKQKAARRVAGQLAATCVVAEAPKQPEPVFEVAKQSDMDARQLEPWFLELPKDERERLRESWARGRHKFDIAGKAARRRLLRAAGYGTLCFVLTGLLMSFLFMNVMVLVRCALVGPIAGVIAQLLGGERFAYGLIGLLGFVVAMGSGIMMPFSFYGMLFCISTMAALGMDGEMRRSAGCRDD